MVTGMKGATLLLMFMIKVIFKARVIFIVLYVILITSKSVQILEFTYPVIGSIHFTSLFASQILASCFRCLPKGKLYLVCLFQEFWRFLLSRAKHWGMIVYEQVSYRYEHIFDTKRVVCFKLYSIPNGVPMLPYKIWIF